MTWLSTTLCACAAIIFGSAALACPNSNGGKVFDGKAIDLCFPEAVLDLTAQGPLKPEGSPDFLGIESKYNQHFAAWLTERTGTNENELTTQERGALAQLFSRDVTLLMFKDLPIKSSAPADAAVQVSWPALASYHGANCWIYLKDSLRLLYCGGVRDSNGIDGSEDLFNQFADMVEFN